MSKKKAGFDLNLQNAAKDINITTGPELLKVLEGKDGQMARAVEANLGSGVEFASGAKVKLAMKAAGQEVPQEVENNPDGLFSVTQTGGKKDGKDVSSYTATRIATSTRLNEIAGMAIGDSTNNELKSRAIENLLNIAIDLDPESRNYLKGRQGGINPFLPTQ